MIELGEMASKGAAERPVARSVTSKFEEYPGTAFWTLIVTSFDTVPTLDGLDVALKEKF